MNESPIKMAFCRHPAISRLYCAPECHVELVNVHHLAPIEISFRGGGLKLLKPVRSKMGVGGKARVILSAATPVY